MLNTKNEKRKTKRSSSLGLYSFILLPNKTLIRNPDHFYSNTNRSINDISDWISLLPCDPIMSRRKKDPTATQCFTRAGERPNIHTMFHQRRWCPDGAFIQQSYSLVVTQTRRRIKELCGLWGELWGQTLYLWSVSLCLTTAAAMLNLYSTDLLIFMSCVIFCIKVALNKTIKQCVCARVCVCPFPS